MTAKELYIAETGNEYPPSNNCPDVWNYHYLKWLEKQVEKQQQLRPVIITEGIQLPRGFIYNEN